MGSNEDRRAEEDWECLGSGDIPYHGVVVHRLPQLAALLIVLTGVSDAAQGGTAVKLYLTAMGDGPGQQIGCGDRLVASPRTLPPTRTPLRAALTAMLETRPSTAGTYNVFARSTLRVDRIDLRAGNAVIQLSGRLVLSGVCDHPRVTGQLQATARQFPSVRAACFFVNGVPLEQWLDESGRRLPIDVCTSRLR